MMTVSAHSSGTARGEREDSPDGHADAATEPSLLVVHDDGLVRSALKERFAREGWNLVEARTVAEALMTLGPAVDIVLLEAQLPHADGPTLLQRIEELSPD